MPKKKKNGKSGVLMGDSPNGFNQSKFVDRLRAVINVARTEGDVSYYEVVGALEVVKLEMWKESQNLENDEEEDF